MNRSTPNSKDVAEAIVANETIANGSSDAKFPPGCLAIEKLRPHLAALMGNTGFNALINRARALGSTDFPWLGASPAKMEGFLDDLFLDDLCEAGGQVESDEFREGCVILLSHLLGLLTAFIGADLTLRLVREIWPELALNDLDAGKGDRNEKRK